MACVMMSLFLCPVHVCVSSHACKCVCVLQCVEGRSQAWAFVMSSLGSFWFSCSSPLFHAALLSNSSGPVTTVLRLSPPFIFSLSLFGLMPSTLLFYSFLTLSRLLLLLFPHLLISVPFPLFLVALTTQMGNIECKRERMRGEREVKEHA